MDITHMRGARWMVPLIVLQQNIYCILHMYEHETSRGVHVH